MKLELKKSWFLFFFLTGFILFFIGCSLAFIRNAMTLIPVILISAGLFELFVSFFLIGRIHQKFFSPTWFFPWLRTAVIVLLSLAFLGGINYFAFQHNQRIDVTFEKQHTLSEETVKIIENLKTNVDINIFYVGLAPKYLEDIFEEYKQHSLRSPRSQGKITYKIYDPLVDLGYAAQFGNVFSGDEKEAIIRSGGERVDIDFKKEALTEEKITNAIIQVTRSKRHIYFLAGHNEYDINDKKETGLSLFRELLEHNNCLVQKLVLGFHKAVPEDCDLLIVAGARNPLPSEDQDIVQNYLEKGGKALFFIESTPIGSPDHPLSEQDKLKNPPLNEILKRWGFAIGDDLVVDLENYVGQDVGCPATHNYPHHKDIVNNIDYTFYIRPRSITLTSDAPSTVKNAPLVLTNAGTGSWAEKSRTLQIKFDSETDTPGPIVIGAIVWEPKENNPEKISDTKIIVFTDCDFISNAFLEKYSNAQLGVNCVGWLTKLDVALPIKAKEFRVQKLELTSRQQRIVACLLIGIVLAIGALGCAVWSRQTI